MSFWRRISPKKAIIDFAEQWQQPTPHRWQILGVAIAATFGLMMLMIPNSKRIEPVRPEIFFISTFAPDRTMEEIIASNEANQVRREERAELMARRDERRRELYRALGRATFIDVDAMEAQIREEEAAEQAAGAAGAIPAPPQASNRQQQSAPRQGEPPVSAE